jgi:glycosyltransferase involved in cell wall biosynthesis
MRVVFLNITAALGGAERLLLDNLASLGQAAPALERHLLLAEDGPLAGLARGLGVTTHLLPAPPSITRLGDSALQGRGRFRRALGLAVAGLSAAPSVWGYARRLRAALGQLAPDVVHSNSLKFHLLTRLASIRGPRVVWHLHDFVGSRPLMRRALRWAAAGAAGAVAISRAVADDARSALPGLPLAVVPNAIDTERFAPGPAADLDALAGLPPADTIRVGLVATYATWKGHDVFLDAARRVVHLNPDLPARFYIVGGPIYRTAGSQWSLDELRQLAGDLVGRHRVGFVGFQHDTAPVYRGLDVVVHASTRPEPFGLTIAEAMACGRAVVVARAGGAAELFADGRDAVGVPPGDPAALAEALGTLLSNAGLRARLGEQARRSAVERFSRGRLGGQLLAAYEQFQASR